MRTGPQQRASSHQGSSINGSCLLRYPHVRVNVRPSFATTHYTGTLDLMGLLQRCAPHGRLVGLKADLSEEIPATVATAIMVLSHKETMGHIPPTEFLISTLCKCQGNVYEPIICNCYWNKMLSKVVVMIDVLSFSTHDRCFRGGRHLSYSFEPSSRRASASTCC